MGPKNPTNGSAPTSMWGSGKIIRSMGLAYSTTKMETNMKEGGVIIRDTGRELSGLATPKTNSGDNTPAIGKTIRKKEEEPCSSKRGTDMMACGWTANPMAKAE